jgi:hypothetical protein
MTGKTTIAKKLVEKAGGRRDILVFDPNFDTWPGATWQTANKDTFIKKFWSVKNTICIVDESGNIDKFDDELKLCATRGRHLGNILIFIAHRLNQLQPVVRYQCTKLYLFRTGIDDCIELARQYADKTLEQAADLPVGTCLYYDGINQTKKMEVFKL